MRVDSGSSVRPSLKPVVFGKPPNHHTGNSSEDNREENNEAANDGALAFASFAR